MKRSILLTFLFASLAISACSSGKEAVEDAAPNPYLGSWVMEGSNNGAISMMGSGDASIEQGDIMTAINRFQNTDSGRYLSRLNNDATYTMNEDGTVTLNVTADWTGKGTGSRKPADKTVASTIVFAVDGMQGNTVTLRQVSMMQDGMAVDNDRALTLTLVKQ